MERGFKKEEEINCQCQCHFPRNVICQINRCCHCVCNYDNPIQKISSSNSVNFSTNLNNNSRNFRSSNLYLNTLQNEEMNNQYLMTSVSTNYNSGSDTFRNNPNSGSKNYYAMRKNHYEEVVNKMRQRYLKDKNHFYAYSNYSLALSFPMIDRYRNEEYINYMDNKSKWISKKDFDRFKQPEREKIYFPRISKEI